MQSNSAVFTPHDLAEVVEAVRAQAPLVHCITNTVVTNITANVLLAAGAAPAMVNVAEEARVLAGVAGALLINLGTIDGVQTEGMRTAVAAATASGVPWVLDPVAVGMLPLRTALAADLVECAPTVVRGNASEISALAGGSGGRGVDSTITPDEVASTARRLAAEKAGAVAASGARDLLTDGKRTVRLGAGDVLLTRVTGVGCALGALTGACAAVTGDPLLAATAATAWMCVAGEDAAAGAEGPGSFAVGLIDHLARLSGEEIGERAQLS